MFLGILRFLSANNSVNSSCFFELTPPLPWLDLYPIAAPFPVKASPRLTFDVIFEGLEDEECY